MIQRIQTIWMLLASVCAFLSIKLPFFVGTKPSGESSYQLNGSENFALLALTIAIGIVSLVAIFLYRDRKTQMRLCVAGIMLEVILLFLYYQKSSSYTAGTYALTALLQALILFLLFLAIRGIRNDNRIIRESDRLR
ncbi:MAG TPA: DUF4293 domain-containing protein [Ferruginibacter sp.]|nr:DUF4293 domain-containing protein [Ferruginibacter sp.]